MEINEVSYLCYIENLDYRTGPTLYINKYNECDSDLDLDLENATEFKFTIPNEGIRIFIVNEFPEYKPIWQIDYNDDTDIQDIYLKIFTQLHGFMPFVVTGSTSSYVDKGYYPEVLDNIKNMKEIVPNDILDTIKNSDNYYFIIAIDDEGNEVISELLRPF